MAKITKKFICVMILLFLMINIYYIATVDNNGSSVYSGEMLEVTIISKDYLQGGVYGKVYYGDIFLTTIYSNGSYYYVETDIDMFKEIVIGDTYVLHNATMYRVDSVIRTPHGLY